MFLSNKFSRQIALLTCALTVIPLTGYGEDNEDRKLLMGVAPFMSPTAIFKRFRPLSQYLGKELGQEVEIEIVRNIPVLMKRIGAQRYDILFAGPGFALKAFDSGVYTPGVMPGKATSAVVVVPVNSQITSMEFLKNKTVAVPPEQGVVAKMAKKFFRAQGLSDELLPQFIAYKSHNAAYHAAMDGDVDAAFIAVFGVTEKTKMIKPSNELARTSPFPGISLILGAHLSSVRQQQIINIMIELDQSVEGREVLEKIESKPFSPITTKEYGVMREFSPRKRPLKGKL